jgi:uncharacterized membrane protein YjjB (DUF3815 family)
MFGTNEFVQLVTAFAGTFAFGVLFNLRGNKLIFTGIGGLFSWFLFLVLGFAIESEAVRYFIVSAVISVYAEVLARALKTPTTPFCIVSLFPLIPGGALYRTMTNALSHDWELFLDNAVYTLELAAALSVGIMLVAACIKYYKKFYKKLFLAKR